GVEGRGERVPDRLATDGGAAALGHSTPFFFASSWFLSCWARVVAKAEWPCLSIATKYSQAPAGGFIAPSRAAWPGLLIGVGVRPALPCVRYGFFGSVSSAVVMSFDGFVGRPVSW